MRVTGDQIVEQARKYINTPFKPKGRVLGQGADCVGLVLMVAGDLRLKDKFGVPLNGNSFTDYSDQPVGNFVHEMCMQHLVYVPIRLLEPGFVVCVNITTAPCHVGFVGMDQTGALTLIHAYNGGPRKVVEHAIDVKWHRRLRGGFSFPEMRR